jgi:hypothetical protein
MFAIQIVHASIDEDGRCYPAALAIGIDLVQASVVGFEAHGLSFGGGGFDRIEKRRSLVLGLQETETVIVPAAGW